MTFPSASLSPQDTSDYNFLYWFDWHKTFSIRSGVKESVT